MTAAEERLLVSRDASPSSSWQYSCTMLFWLTLATGTLAALILSFFHGPRPANKSLCEAKWCKSLTEVMDFSVDPCEDFYKFSCGKWAQLNPPPSPSTQHWTNFVKLDRANLALLRKVLERPSPHLPRLLPRMKTFYRQCKARDKVSLTQTRREV